MLLWKAKECGSFLRQAIICTFSGNNPTEYCLGERGSVISFMGEIL